MSGGNKGTGSSIAALGVFVIGIGLAGEAVKDGAGLGVKVGAWIAGLVFFFLMIRSAEEYQEWKRQNPD